MFLAVASRVAGRTRQSVKQQSQRVAVFQVADLDTPLSFRPPYAKLFALRFYVIQNRGFHPLARFGRNGVFAMLFGPFSLALLGVCGRVA